MLFDPADLKACQVDELPERRGPCYLGFDMGGAASMCAAVGYWPDTLRMEIWAAFPGIPGIAKRGEKDGVGDAYEKMVGRGELWIYEDWRITPVTDFLKDVAGDLQDEDIAAVGSDRYRSAEALQAIDDAELDDWPYPTWRGTGASKTADGSHDVRACQRAFIGRKVQVLESLALMMAILGNPDEVGRWRKSGAGQGRDAVQD